MMKSKKLWAIDAMIILGTLVALGLIVNYAISEKIAFSPEEAERTDTLFRLEGVDEISLDDNSQFRSPEKIEIVDGERIELRRGNYYLKTVHGDREEIRTIETEEDIVFVLEKNVDGSISVRIEEGTYAVEVKNGKGEHVSDVVLEVGDAS
jgi:hypothetical protein